MYANDAYSYMKVRCSNTGTCFIHGSSHMASITCSKEGCLVYETSLSARVFKLIMIKYILLYFNLL